MTFITKGAIFKNTREKLQKLMGDRFDESKKYPEVDGSFAVKDEERMAFASYIMNAPLNDKNEIPIKVSGYNNVSANGVKYISLTIQPDYKTQKAITDKLASATAVSGAKDLAKAFPGSAVGEVETDSFF